MYWIGESVWGIKRLFKKVPGEIIQGLKDNIPICCVTWYTLAKLMTIIPTAMIRSLLKEKLAKGFSLDFYVFCRMFGGKLNKEKRTFEVPEFWHLQYFRCPLCRLLNFQRKLYWDGRAYWDWAGIYKDYYWEKYRERMAK